MASCVTRLRQRVDRVLQVQQLALAGFLLPLRRVVVAVEDDPLVLLDDLGEELADGLVQVLALGRRRLELVGDRVERIGHRRVQHHVREGDALPRRHGAELELVAGERERAGAVAIARVARQLRQHADAEVLNAALLGGLGAALLDLLEDVGEHLAEEDRQNRRRRLVRAKTMIVAGAGDAGAQQSLPAIDGAKHGRAEHQELHVVVRRIAGAEQVVAELVGQRPVIVLARSVDAGKRLLVQQAARPYFGAIFFNISIVIIW